MPSTLVVGTDNLIARANLDRPWAARRTGRSNWDMSVTDIQAPTLQGAAGDWLPVDVWCLTRPFLGAMEAAGQASFRDTPPSTTWANHRWGCAASGLGALERRLDDTQTTGTQSEEQHPRSPLVMAPELESDLIHARISEAHLMGSSTSSRSGDVRSGAPRLRNRPACLEC